MERNFLVILGALCLCFSLNAQQLPHKACGHDAVQRGIFDTEEEYNQAKKKYIEEAIPQFLKAGAAKSGTTLNVPVVFHILHDGEAIGVGKNVSDGRILAQLEVLNKDFSATNDNFNDTTRTTWDAVKDNAQINFCLTKEDPLGNTSTGILRHQIAITGIDANNNNIETVKDSIHWNSNKFLNIYVLSIPGTDANGGVVGYAFLPYFGTVGESHDGIVVDYNWFGGPGYSQSGDRTLTHEMGHYLGLFHTFDGDSCSNDDGLSDTPNLNTSTSSLAPSLNCGDPMNSYPTGPSSCSDEHMYVNYMDYINDDSCPTSFTAEQVAVIRGVLLGTATGFESREDLLFNSITVCGTCDLAATLTKSDPSCDVSNDGSVTIQASNGTQPYTYTWSTNPVQDSATAVNLSPGSYSVTIEDANGCQVVLDTALFPGSDVDFSLNKTDESSIGASDGTVSISIVSGTAPYTYFWDNGLSSDSTHTNLSPGTYGITVEDANGCSTSDTLTINPGPCVDLDLSVTIGDVSCNAGNDGQALITISNGVAPFNYSWNGINYSNERIDLMADSYIVVATDAVGCTGSISFGITEPSLLTANMTTSDISGVGLIDGSATVSTSGGIPGYSYLWSTGETTSVIQNLSPGVYSVTITDQNGCSSSVSGEVMDFDCSALSITIDSNEISCFGDTAILTAIPIGTSPFTFAWSTQSTNQTIYTVDGGTYTVTVVDANGCVGIVSHILSDAPDELSLSFVAFSESGIGEDDGSIELSVEGGTPNYTYSWSNGSTNATATNLVPDDYSFTVTDANGCSIIGQATVNAFECSALAVSLTPFDVGCYGDSTGSAVVSNSSGRAPFSFLWSTGDSTQAIGDLPQGAYMVTVTDANGCSGVGETLISQPNEMMVDFQIVNESGENTNDGQIQTNVSGGNAPYAYSWQDGSSDPNRNGLSPGDFLLLITDSLGCTLGATATVLEFTCDDIVIDPVVQDVVCSGGSSGAIDLNILMIAAPYSVSWSNGSSGEVLTGLSVGFYSASITDNTGCKLIQNFNITEPPSLTVSAQIQMESALNANDGVVSLSVTGGIFPYTYLWSNGLTTADISNLSPGEYIVSVTDENGCLLIDSFSVEEYVCPPFDILSITTTDNLCSDDEDGSISIVHSGGSAPFNYIWSNGSSTLNQSNLASGTYALTITDIQQCQLTTSVIISSPAPLTITPQVSHVTAVNANDGTINATVSGGIGPFSYSWSNNDSTSQITDLSIGTYSLTVTDLNNCSQIIDVEIEEYTCPEIALIFSKKEITCNGLSNGIIGAVPTNGTGPFSYLWSNGNTTDSITNLSPGDYWVEITDSKGCSVIDSTALNNPDQLEFTSEIQHETANDQNDGSLVLTITGGVAPYIVNWTDGTVGVERNNLVPGLHGFVINDQNGCSIPSEIVINEFVCQDLNLNVDVFDNNCSDGDVGGVEVILTNGVGPLEYYLNGELQENNASIRGLTSGVYTLEVIDANNCSDSVSFDIETPLELYVNDIITSDAFDNKPGYASIGIGGGFSPYSYEWSDGRTLFENANLFAGIHDVTITDSQGCTLVQEIVIYQGEELDDIEELELFQAHPNPANNVVNLQVEFESIRSIRIVITSLTGIPVYEEQLDTELYNKNIDVSLFSKGHYKIAIYSNDEVITKTLVIL